MSSKTRKITNKKQNTTKKELIPLAKPNKNMDGWADMYSISINKINKNPTYKKKFVEKCVQQGVERLKEQHIAGSDIDPVRKVEFKNYCKCILNNLSTKTIKEVVSSKNMKELDVCVSNLHQEQKTYLTTLRSKRLSKNTVKTNKKTTNKATKKNTNKTTKKATKKATKKTK